MAYLTKACKSNPWGFFINALEHTVDSDMDNDLKESKIGKSYQTQGKKAPDVPFYPKAAVKLSDIIFSYIFYF